MKSTAGCVRGSKARCSYQHPWCKSSNKGVGFLSDGGRKAGDFHRSKDGGRAAEERGVRGEGGEGKGKSEVRRKRRRWGDAGFHTGCCPTFTPALSGSGFPKKKSLLLPKLSCNCVKKENWDLTADVLHQSSYGRKAEHLQLLVRKRKLQLEQDLTARTEQRRNMLLI